MHSWVIYHRMCRRIHNWDGTADRPLGFWCCHSDADLCSCWSTTRAPTSCDTCTRWGQSCWTVASAVRNSPLSFVHCTKTWPETDPVALLFRSCQARSRPNRSNTSERSPCFTTIIVRFLRVRNVCNLLNKLPYAAILSDWNWEHFQPVTFFPGSLQVLAFVGVMIIVTSFLRFFGLPHFLFTYYLPRTYVFLFLIFWEEARKIVCF